jgi:tRNA nucleotidyltransferase/poly(A) polymerase
MTPNAETDQRIAELTAKALSWIQRGREANIKAGRIFLEIKKLLGHGHWKKYFKKMIAPHGVPLRTAETWMKMAKEEDAKVKNADSAFSQDAQDQRAVEIRRASDRAVIEMSQARGGTWRAKRERERPYNLPLHLDAEQRDAVNRFRRAPDWEPRVIDALMTLVHKPKRYPRERLALPA